MGNDDVPLLLFLPDHGALIPRLVNLLPLPPQLFDEFVDLLCCVGLERVLDGGHLLLLLPLDFQQLLLLLLRIGRFGCLPLLFLQDGCILVSSLLGLSDRLLDLLVDDIELIVLMNLLEFLLIFQQAELGLFLLLKLLVQHVLGSVSCVHLYSPGGLFLVLLSELYLRVLFEVLHVLAVVVLQLCLRLGDVLP